jgi:hypothetical protein
MSSRTDETIFERVIDPSDGTMPPEAARYILSLDFPPADHARMDELSVRAQEGRLTADEETELDDYLHVGHVMALMQSKARRSLRLAGMAV